MTLLYLDDQKDYLFGLLSRFFDEIVTGVLDVEEAEKIHVKSDDISYIVANLATTESLPLIAAYKTRYPELPMIVVNHENIDLKQCIALGVEGFILYPYNEVQIDQVITKYKNLKNYSDLYHKKEQSHRDHITSLLNAESLHDKIKGSSDNALILMNIDNFDFINTLYGMDMGDKVLSKVAGYLSKMVPSNSTLHRLNADEFVLFLEKPVNNQEDMVSRQIKSFFEMIHFQVERVSFNLRVSIGISSGLDTTLFHHAKMALNEAKENGKNRIVFYNETSPYLRKQKETKFWINEVESALEEDRIRAYYQPIYDNVSRRVVKYEALCRIEDRIKQILQPNDFIPAALISGQMTKLTRAMIDKAFKMFSDNDYDFSINVTQEDFEEVYLLSFLKSKCYLYNINPSRVFIEIVENISFDVTEGHLDQIRALSEHGFKMAIDDFGTESSNYSRFLNIKADYLKIDGRFVNNIDQNKNSQIIVGSIVEFARKIGAKTIAEFVDSPSVLKMIQQLGVDYSQGYYIGKPQPELIEQPDYIISNKDDYKPAAVIG